MDDLESTIENAFENRNDNSLWKSPEIRKAVDQAIALLDNGSARVAEPNGTDWVVNQWLKKAVLLSFIISKNNIVEGNWTKYFDKVPAKFDSYGKEEFDTARVRIVPPAMVRKGAYIGPNTVLMPSYVNIGAWIGEGTMVDTWATVGSCAQIGANVHLSGGVGIGGVLEPLQASPTIIEDNCFIGARSEVVEGVIVGHGSVISMGVYLGQSTRILDRQTGNVSYGRVPPGSVVVSGSIPASDNSHSLYCAVIVKQVDEKTKNKVGINQLLREI
jgi:2,3,4,5-tetrahydropyridine-2-carboxylate N-succinyltransferase